MTESNDLSKIINEILSSKVPEGTIKKIPFSVKKGITFSYGGKDILISPIYANLSSNCYFFDIKWGNGENERIYGVPIKSGVNIMEQFKLSPIKMLYAFDTKNIGGDIVDYTNTILYMIDKGAI